MLKVAPLALLALAIVALISACGGSSSGSDDAAAGDDSGQVLEHVDDADAAEGGGDEIAHVTLAEWSITPAHGEGFEASAGEVVFEVHNDGAAAHDLLVIKTDLAPDALPIADGVVDQEAAGEVIGKLELIPSGEIVVEPYDFEPGNYVLICTVPGHYQQGMNASLTVQ